jgi:DeoR/GlpR family transcriptional regulator of sugar metabolism
MKKLTESDKKAIVTAIQAGQATMTQLAERYEVSIATISYHFHALTGERLKPMHVLSPMDKDQIVQALQAGNVTIGELAGTYGVSPQTISRVFKDMTGRAVVPRLSKSDQQTIVAALPAGNVTIKELAANYHVDPDTISRTFKRITGKAFSPRLRLSPQENELAENYGVDQTTISKL